MNTTATLPLGGGLAHYEVRMVRRIAAGMRPPVAMDERGAYFRPADVPVAQRARFLAALKRMNYGVMLTAEPGLAAVVREDYRREFEQVVAGLEARVAEIAATGRRSRAAALAVRAAVLRAKLADPFAAAVEGGQHAEAQPLRTPPASAPIPVGPARP